MAADVYLVDAVVYDKNLAATRTLRYATGLGHVTGPAETPADTYYDPRIKQPLQMTRTMFGQNTTRGRSTTGFGDLVLLNGDMALDTFLATLRFDGRAITVRRGAVGAAYPSGFTTDLIGTMAVPEVTQEQFIIKLRDRQEEVVVPLQTTKFSGAGLGTLEGVAGDLKGKPKPVCYGQVFNIAPPCVETAKLIYQVNDATISTLNAVYDRGVALVDHGSNYATTTDLLDNAQAPASGKFKLYKGSEGSYFRLGAAPSGLITADVTEGTAASDRTVAQVYKRLLVRSGKSASDYSAGDLTTLDTAANYVIGYWTDQETDYATVFDAVAGSVGAAWFIDRTGVFRIKQLLAPSGSPVATFTEHDILKDRPLLRIATNDPGQGLPSFQTIVRYKRNFTVQEVDVPATVSQAQREFLANEYREAKALDSTIQTESVLAIQNEETTLLTVEADAQAEATRIQGLRGVQRDMFQMTMQLNATTAAIDLNDVIGLRHNRYGLSVVGGDNPSLFRVLGISVDGEQRRVTFTAWGSAPSTTNWIDDLGNYMTDDLGNYFVFET